MTTIIPQSSDPSIRYLSTAKAYDLWAEVYDTDGNFLQALDTIEMKGLMPRMLAQLEDAGKPWRLVDLGCGTGRNTLALLKVEGNESVVGLDSSAGMLDVAAKRLKSLGLDERLRLETFDMIQNPSPPDCAAQAHAVVSTLVIEHVPADVFFGAVAKILRPGGILLLTNMHSEMGGLSQAGFVDPRTGEKVRPTSYAHTIADVETAAANHGFEVVGRIEEKSVTQEMVPLLGERSRKYLGVTVWFGGLLRKKA